ncbi:MAG: hypothetical protein J5I92_00955 [Thiogranum sp.]|nr:hypothetical protein [Thiogranum sp.]
MIALLFSICSACLCAGGKSAADMADQYWYDGERQRGIWQQPGLIAEFGDIGPSGGVAAIYPNAVPLSQPSGQVRIWRLPGTDAQELIQSMHGSSARLSPVFGDHPQGGRLRSLPGGIIVQFQTDWHEARIRDWLQAKGLVPGKRLEFIDNAWRISTPSGIAALQTANALYETDQVRAAFPDWWEETSLR